MTVRERSKTEAENLCSTFVSRLPTECCILSKRISTKCLKLQHSKTWVSIVHSFKINSTGKHFSSTAHSVKINPILISKVLAAFAY